MAETKSIDIGQKAPAFTLLDQAGEKVSLTDFAGRWVVLYFYPKDDTPGCTTEACDFSNGLKQFEVLNAVVLGVSPDSPESHRKFAEKYRLQINLLADPEKQVLQRYGAFGEKMMYGKPTVGVIRSTFLIGPDGRIAHVWRNVKAAGHVEKVAEKLAELAA